LPGEQRIVSNDVIKRAEVFAAVLISLLIFFLLIVRAQHAGGLWRDECTSMRLAGASSIADIRERYPYPLLHPAIVRLHTALFGESDTSLRTLGVETGLALIGVAWLNAWLTGSGAPLIFLPLMGLNALFLTWGTTIRGYGLGTVMIVQAIGLAGRFVIKPTKGVGVMLFLVLLASPQLLAHDSPLVFTISAAAILVCVARGRIKLALILMGITALVGLSCLPYLLDNFNRAQWLVLKYHASLGGIWRNFAAACGPPAPIMPVVWCALFFLACGGALGRLGRVWRHRTPESDLLCFALLAGALSIPGYFAFLRVLNYWPHPWYYLPLLGTLAAATELMISGWLHVFWIRFSRLVFAIAIAALLPFAAWPKLLERQSNIDWVAHDLEKSADAKDLIVINPWDHGVTFYRYFHGTARWVTVPMMDDHRGHRYDLLKAKMMAPNPLDDLLPLIAQTLRSGGRVWLVGGAQLLNPGETPHWLPPAPNSEFGWNNDVYKKSWSQELGAFLQQHVLAANMLPDPTVPINEVENDPVWKLEGWRD
jgi:hypothetical protein